MGTAPSRGAIFLLESMLISPPGVDIAHLFTTSMRARCISIGVDGRFENAGRRCPLRNTCTIGKDRRGRTVAGVHSRTARDRRSRTPQCSESVVVRDLCRLIGSTKNQRVILEKDFGE
jgi:hypothetical protein